jgi:hypothetical protein
MTPYPGTELYDYAKKENLLPATLSYDDFRHGGENLRPFLNALVAPDKLVAMKNEFNGLFANKIAANYLRQPAFIADLLGLFVTHPAVFGRFMKKYVQSGNFGSALKLVLPHKL